MKKVLLLLSALFTFGSVMAADPVVSITTVAANQKSKVSSYTSNFKIGESGSDLTWTVVNFNNNNSATNWNNVRCGSKSAASVASITTDFAINEKIGSVAVELTRFQNGADDKMNSMSLLVSKNSDMSDAVSYAADITGLPTAKNGTATIVIPVTSPEEGMYYQLSIEMPKVSNNGVFSVNSLSYYGEGGVGEVTMAEYATISEFLAAKPTADSKLATELTAIYKNGRNLYLTDGNDFLLAYNANDIADVTNLTISNGDKISFLIGNYKNQSNLPELIPSGIGEVTTGGAPVVPEVLSIEEIGTDMLSKYVKIEGVNIVATDANNTYTATDETGSITVYNTFYNSNYYDAVTVPEGENFNITGFVTVYGNTLQISPILIEGGKVIETVATPVITPNTNSELAIGDQITITCETEGATIYFTTEDETPTTASQRYTGPMTYSEPVTIRAIAVKEGWFDSKVAEATYTTAVAGALTATVDFTETGNISDIYTGTATLEAGNSQTAGEANDLNGATFVAGPFNVTISKGESGTEPRWWETATIKKELRTYSNNTITISANQDGYKLTGVKFFQGTSTASNFSKLTATIDTNNGPATFGSTSKSWSAEDNEVVNKVVITIGATNRSGGFEITYVEDETALAGIEEIAGDVNNSNAPVEYFNLQGVRVNSNNVTPGIYIRRQGTEATKVLVK